MKRYWEQLKPVERRWGMGIGFVLFLVLNYFFVWPHRHDWGNDQVRIKNAEAKLATYNKEIAKKRVYDTRLRDLQADGSQVMPEEQAIDFVHFYSSRLLTNHVLLLNGGTLTTRTNAFFLEQQLGIQVQADETNLVNFLYSLAAGNSMVRVRSMTLHPNPDHHELNAGITMVASYQKKTPPPRAATTPVKNTTPSPASTAVKPSAPAPQPKVKPALTPAPAGVTTGKPPPPQNTNIPPPSDKMARFLRPGSTTNKPPQ